MKEIFNRLSKNPGRTLGLVIISFIANILALASSVFVMLVLGRYVTYGVDATLFTLVGGVIIAVIMEFSFRQLRLRMVRNSNASAEAELAIGAFGTLITCRPEALNNQTAKSRPQLLRDLETVSSAFNASNICTVLDVPFALLFIAALFMLNTVLGVIATMFVILVLLFRFVGQMIQKQQAQTLQEATARSAMLFGDVIRSPDTARVFDLNGWLIKTWTDATIKMNTARSKIVQSNGAIEISIASIQILLGVVIIAVGATFVVAGELDVGALIGANILAARALAPVSRLSQLSPLFGRAGVALAELRAMATLNTEEGLNSPANAYSGQLELRDISFTHDNSPAPLFESLNLSIPAGGFLLIKGANGAGKTTLIRLILGLLVPGRGQILADGVNVRQLSAQWWREHSSYMPQEPYFFDASIRSNLQNANPSVSEKQLTAILENSGLKQYIQENALGIDMQLTAGGTNLALGIRKRLALARAMVNDAPIVFFDAPTEGLDTDGRARVHAALDWLSKQGRTVIVASDDRNIVSRADIVLDLDRKPVPAVAHVAGAPSLSAVKQ